ncbi:hypothetical protein PVK06_036900 [Gossypium arboreum]|uniref:WIYLD domain-containing protein n=1 Tax=Gossypium arboreum TaxID=29729 RepID=A0ABR0NKS9_GOSAR|nr:hypothetical protein PVK06_036900 [Gossypium arboreum]
MPPRRRPKKKSNTRKDAAIDAMKPYGFPVDVVQTTIKDLLNVYGEDGWPFIEDSAYKVLLEAILEKVTGEGTSDPKEPVAETSSRTAVLPICSDVSPLNTESQASNGFDGASELNKTLCIPKPTNESVIHCDQVTLSYQLKPKAVAKEMLHILVVTTTLLHFIVTTHHHCKVIA